MTTEKETRIIDALIETATLLSKELSYSPQFRNSAVIEAYRAHMDELRDMLECAITTS